MLNELLVLLLELLLTLLEHLWVLVLLDHLLTMLLDLVSLGENLGIVWLEAELREGFFNKKSKWLS